MYRLVVIDDEYIVVQGIKALISRLKLDYEVVGAAYDGIQGLEVIRSEKPDVVITDIRIPGLDGLSVIEAAKEECPDTYFIVISGYSEFVYAQRALTLGVKDYIDKPVTADKLKNALTRIEDEWAKTRHEDNRKAQANREKFQELEAEGKAPANIRFICMDANDLPTVFAPAEVSRIYLNFSDPWPKARHARRRLTSNEFFKLYDQVLTTDGTVEFKTDNRPLFDFSVEELETSELFVLDQLSYDLHNDSTMNQGNIMTEYEAKFSSMGNPICKLIAKRR